VPRLVRDELKLAVSEMESKGSRAATGVGYPPGTASGRFRTLCWEPSALCRAEEVTGQVTLTGRLLRESRRQDPGLAIAAAAVEERLSPMGVNAVGRSDGRPGSAGVAAGALHHGARGDRLDPALSGSGHCQLQRSFVTTVAVA
jgi:hypothetical protein